MSQAIHTLGLAPPPAIQQSRLSALVKEENLPEQKPADQIDIPQPQQQLNLQHIADIISQLNNSNNRQINGGDDMVSKFLWTFF